MTATDILTLRNSLSKTQQEFSEMLNVTVKTISMWENGKSKPSKVFILIMKGMRQEHNNATV